MLPFKRSLREPGDWPSWLGWLVVVLAGLTWPLWGGFRLAQSVRFWLVVRRARGNQCTLANDGIEVSVNGGPAQSVSWSELAAARWLERLVDAPDFDEERLAVSLRRSGLALSEGSGDLQAIFKELARRGAQPRVIDGGKGWNMLDGLLMLAWWAVVLVIALVVWG